ncbi:MAG: tetratricopeptide repeat protein [Verrucomicrobiae bacterium]|nr:tetratricopeptide repeat protein [Verrucomicrobiae bacterium]MDW8344985.1 tetratricopeptide repeat protein [Verrucomicrobiae bacterium]
MRKLVLLFGWLWCGCLTIVYADPGEQFLQAYFLVQEADQAQRQNDLARAARQYREAQSILRAIRTAAPDWNTHIIDFRLRYCAEQLAKLADHLPPEPPTAAAPAAPTAPVAPAVAAAAPRPEDEKRIQELTDELNRAQQQIRDLEASRAALETRLREALQRATVTETTPQLEQLLTQNRRLTEQLAAAQQRIQDLTDQADQLQQARERIRALETTRDALTAELAQTRAQLRELETNHPRVAELERRNRELTEELAKTRQELETVRSGAAPAADPAEIARLREELEASRQELEQTRRELAEARQQTAALREELAGLRARYGDLQRQHDSALQRLRDAEVRINSLEAAGKKDNELIVFLRKENALLKQIVERYESRGARTDPTGPRRGFVFYRRPHVAPSPSPSGEAAVQESKPGRLVAELAAQPVAEPPASAPASPPVTPFTTAPAKAEPAPRANAPGPLQPSAPELRDLLREGQRAAEQRDYATAKTKFEAILERDPNNVLALSNLGVVHYQLNELEEAETCLRRAVALAPNDAESRSLLGIVYFRRGKVDDAFAELTRAVAINPRHAEAHNYLGITLSEKGWTAAAEQQIRKAIELNPNYADAHFNLAVLYVSLRTPRYELARYHYQKALDLGANPDPRVAELIEKGLKK